jgi:hypothetical protein
LIKKLTALKPPGDVVERIIAWVVEAGGIDPDRCSQLRVAMGILMHMPFSTSARRKIWRRFMDETVGGLHAEPRLFS